MAHWSKNDYTLKRFRDLHSNLGDLYGETKSQNPDVALGLYGEEARLKGSVGSTLAASSSDVGGTFNKSPLFGISSEFATKRIGARQRFQQARLGRLLGISSAMSNVLGQESNYIRGMEGLSLQKQQGESNIWGSLLGTIGGGVLGGLTGGVGMGAGEYVSSKLF